VCGQFCSFHKLVFGHDILPTTRLGRSIYKQYAEGVGESQPGVAPQGRDPAIESLTLKALANPVGKLANAFSVLMMVGDLDPGVLPQAMICERLRRFSADAAMQ
jgi:hypothetical protein